MTRVTFLYSLSKKTYLFPQTLSLKSRVEWMYLKTLRQPVHPHEAAARSTWRWREGTACCSAYLAELHRLTGTHQCPQFSWLGFHRCLSKTWLQAPFQVPGFGSSWPVLPPDPGDAEGKSGWAGQELSLVGAAARASLRPPEGLSEPLVSWPSR